MRMRSHPSQSGVALVTTVIIVAVLAVVAVAFMQSTSTDRLSSRTLANYYRAQLAAESGIAAGMAAISGGVTEDRLGPAQWNYITGHLTDNPLLTNSSVNAESESFAFIAQINPANADLLNTRYLVSSPGDFGETLVPLDDGESGPRYPAGWVSMTSTNASGLITTNARFAFWISDDTTKVNAKVTGSASPRSFATDPSRIALMLRAAANVRGASQIVPPSILSRVVSSSPSTKYTNWGGVPSVVRDAPVLLTPATLSLLLRDTGLFTGLMPSLEHDVADATISAQVAPNGQPKLNLTRLKAYLDSLPKSQIKGNRRFEAVEGILDSGRKDLHKRWGGGHLALLRDPAVLGGKYTDLQLRQFVANLFDVIDEDFIPTTDDADNPTVFGTEMRYVAGGGLQGHPVMVYAGTGHFAGRRNANGSSRVRTHLGVGLANPWSVETDPWSKYRLDFQVTPSSSVFPNLSTENAEQLSATPSSMSGSNGGIPPRSGYLFPCGSSAAPHYSSFADRAGELPEVTGLGFTLNRLRLIYNSTEGDFVVGIVPGAPLLKAQPENVPKGGDGQNRTVWQSGREAYWLRADLRLPAQGGNWTIVANGGGGNASGTIPGPSSAIPYMASEKEGDGSQGLSGSIGADMASTDPKQWYRSSAIANHLNMDGSLSFEAGKLRINSTGLVGFLSVGKPWQTLTLHAANDNNPAGQEDWKLLDYIYAGSESSTGNEALQVNMAPNQPYGPGGDKADWPGGFSRNASANPQNVNWNTWRSILEGVPGVDADELASQLALGAAEPSGGSFDFLKVTAGAELGDTDFERERLARYLADLMSSRSQSFTVYAVGEALAPVAEGQQPRVASRVRGRGRVQIGLEPANGGVTVKLQRMTFY
jgi:hypothetical protein